MIDILPIEPKDIDDVVRLIYRAITITNAPDYHPDVIIAQSIIFDVKWVKNKMQTRYMVIAKYYNIIAGVGSFTNGEMMSIYVDPDYEKKGLGRAIMYHLEEHAKDQGYSVVNLGSSKTAVNFYRKLGYSLDEEVEFESGGHTVIGYHMSKKLF